MVPRSSSGLTLPLTLAASVALHAAVSVAFVLGSGRAAEAPAADPPPQLAGDTFELPAPDLAAVPLANASPSPDLASPAAAPDEDAPGPAVEPETRRRPARRAKADRPSKPTRPSGGRATDGAAESASSGGDKRYGAVGDRSATGLGSAFTMSFAQATSSNPIWGKAPLGPAGEAVVVLELDESGHLVSHRIEGAPSAALTAGIKATLTLIGQRPFVARGRITRLHVTATISPSEPRDDMHGVYGIGRGDGHAYFSLPMGRKIDVKIRER